MMRDIRHTRRDVPHPLRRWAACAGAVALLVLAGCKSDKDAKGNGTGVARGKDPLVYGPNLIPKQNMPIPDRATGPAGGKPDPLTTPTGGGKVGYNADPERFKGPVILGTSSTPASLAGRIRDGDELKIESPGVTLTQVGGTLPGGDLEAPQAVDSLYKQLEQKYGVKPADRNLERENNQWVFRASVVIGKDGARRQYSGAAGTAPDAIKQVIDQLAIEP
ncbi:hypothetical protein [Frigoriglobus tundricola]|uniref:Lipoprotein n=1 Tax=Frigoriglobus tundricola TaxID=2774151 RepID=A0A6M5YS95_9BACT|nr:hypothetical protein [Frigoriglobus tundricola]QJW96163.1 hypothetical protein FTUN_3719 [Frigoriglobus tundricola]